MSDVREMVQYLVIFLLGFGLLNVIMYILFSLFLDDLGIEKSFKDKRVLALVYSIALVGLGGIGSFVLYCLVFLITWTFK